jgi:hypothetical protein
VSAVAARAKGKAPSYKRHEPESTALHEIVRDHLEEFQRFTREHYARPLPRYVERELRPYLDWATLLARTFGVDAPPCPRCIFKAREGWTHACAPARTGPMDAFGRGVQALRGLEEL